MDGFQWPYAERQESTTNLHTIYLCNIHKIENNCRGREYVADVQGSRVVGLDDSYMTKKVIILGDVCDTGLFMYFSGNGLQKSPTWRKVM